MRSLSALTPNTGYREGIPVLILSAWAGQDMMTLLSLCVRGGPDLNSTHTFSRAQLKAFSDACKVCVVRGHGGIAAITIIPRIVFRRPIPTGFSSTGIRI